MTHRERIAERSAATKCPCCGGALDHLDGVRWNPEARVLLWPTGGTYFTPREATLFDALWESMPSGQRVSRERLADKMYADDIDGGPESLNILSVHLSTIRTKLLGSPLAIPLQRGTYGGYWLTRVSTERAG